MKSVQITGYGGKEVVKIVQDAPMPSPSAGQLLVEIHAAAINPVDWKIREGYMKSMAPLKFPSGLGGDFAGKVVIGAAGFRKGDRVFGYGSVLRGNSGSFAEFATVNAGVTAKIPEGMGFQQAAALALAGICAWDAIVNHMKLSKGQKILIHGGAGGIGSLAIQLAKKIGAYVATTVGPTGKEFAKSLGADVVIDYSTQKFETIVKGYDAVLDCVGGETYSNSFKILKKGGIVVALTSKPDAVLAEKYGVRAEGVSGGEMVTPANLLTVAKLGLNAHIDRIFPLDEAAEALEHQRSAHPKGKVVIKVK